MKRNLITIITAAVLVVIFALLLFTFQVRQSEVAVVTTFGKITGTCQPGLHLRWPWPIQEVYHFDQRIQNFEDNFSENLTADSINLLVSVYVGWKITDAPEFLNSFKDGSIAAAQNQLQGMLTSAKSAVVGSNTLSAFVNADPQQLKFDQIQNEIEQSVREELRTNNYGIQIEFLGIKKLGLPDSVTEAVFTRMKSERNILISQAQNEGLAEATKIKANADRQASITLSDAQAQATRIEGKGVTEAAKTLSTFQENPELSVFLLRIKALEQSLNQKTVVMFDQHMPPFDLFQEMFTNSPSH